MESATVSEVNEMVVVSIEIVTKMMTVYKNKRKHFHLNKILEEVCSYLKESIERY